MVVLSTLDYILIGFFFLITLLIGILVSKKSGKNSSEFFLSGKNMPWWLLGLSMVATTFSTDTPNLVTDIVRQNGVSGNWVWWAFLLTGLLTVFVYAKLWRKSNVNTDIEFYELRYGGKPARFLRGFRSIYLGVVFNVLAMAGVTLAAIKIGQVMLGLEPWQIIVSAGLITVVFSAFGGFRGVVYTDFLLFFVAMIGAIAAAFYIVSLPEIGGLDNLLTHKNVINKTSFIPDFSDTNSFITILIIPLAVQWWSSWYPGAEPGGGGYIAQRMLAAKNQNHAIGATFFFNIMYFALRPWPWIIVALASLVVYPDLASIKADFPNISNDKLGHDLAYSAMLTKLPSGLLGLVLASLVAAYMSTISTHLNWGASYVVNDFYKQKIAPNASEKKLVLVGRVTTVVLMVLSSLLALQLTDAMQLFSLFLMFGAGTGLLFLLRWFWWRINAWSEISAMVSSGIISITLNQTIVDHYLFDINSGLFPVWAKYPLIVLLTTIVWITVTYCTKPESDKVLYDFYAKIQPGGKGWKSIVTKASSNSIQLVKEKEGANLPQGILAMILGCFVIYGCLFTTGFWIYGEYKNAFCATLGVFIFAVLLLKVWRKINKNVF
ncbi:Na+/proline symporter [Wenyingzhuangia heitensis]|uniref:Na+/proline symporter n=1 Tax=Wenyingzhuangia heitensis TaxID=1487859 RepID=A0ABX0UB08_9FLAO|nr:sodium:solute symporter family protein [Wenyingzhuangia heitensis]NIJ45908.1 Na+/proline symporter [Wenyingzhuangia heitensis]